MFHILLHALCSLSPGCMNAALVCNSPVLYWCIITTLGKSHWREICQLLGILFILLDFSNVSFDYYKIENIQIVSSASMKVPMTIKGWHDDLIHHALGHHVAWMQPWWVTHHCCIQHHADPTGCRHSLRVCMMHQCSTGRVLTIAALVHHDNKYHLLATCVSYKLSK